jgi:hypothetical protein
MPSFLRNPPPKVFHGHAAVGDPLAGPRQTRSPVEYRVSYINNTYRDVTIAWRSGFSFVIPACENTRFGETFILRMEISLAPWVRIDVEKLLSHIRDDSNAELKAMKEAIEIQASRSRHGGTMLTIDYPVTLEQLEKYGGAVYYSEIDQIVSILPPDKTPLHPYSDRGRTAYPEDNHGSRTVGFVYNIEIIDNSGKIGNRFVNINGQVYPLQPKRDYGRRDGVYVRTTGHADDNDNLATTHRRVCFESAKKELNVWPTHEDALTLGDPVNARNTRAAELEVKLQQMKIDSDIIKQQHGIEKLERERELRISEDARNAQQAELARLRENASHTLEMRRIETKDRYEERSYVRKDSSEVIKALPSAIVGLGAVVMAVKAFL